MESRMQPRIPTIIRRGLRTARRLLGEDLAGRNFKVFPDDSLIVSYPRSGSTWLRFLIGNLIQRDRAVSFHEIERVIPDIHVNSRRYINGIPRPRLLKSHEYFDPRYRKVVYLVRDPRDVALSYYRYYRKLRVIPDGYPMNLYIASFLSGEMQSWGSWGENVGSWIGARGQVPDFILIRYEDLLIRTKDQLSKVTEFLNIPCNDDDLNRTVELSSAERMRDLEKSEGRDWVTIRGSREDLPFIGKASSGQWRTELDQASVSMIETAWGNWIIALGYDHSRNTLSDSKVLDPQITAKACLLSTPKYDSARKIF